MNGMNDDSIHDDNRTFPNENPAEPGSSAQMPPQSPPQSTPIGFCQNCGKSLDATTIRKVGHAVYCEPCLAAKIGAGAGATAPPPPGYGPVNVGGAVHGYPVNGQPIFTSSTPNPGLAALLGLIPGVGAMYNEQYAKGVVHLIIFAVLTSFSHVPGLGIFGFASFCWICYMSIEAHHTAKARRDGTPLPNPFGFNDIGERMGFNGSNGGPDIAGAARDAAQAAAAGFNAAAAGFNKPPYTPPQPAPGWGAPVEQYPPAPGFSGGVAQETGAPYTQPPYTHPPYTNVPYQETYVPPVPPVPPIPPIPPVIPANRFPAGAVWLIGLGLIFLLVNLHIFNAVPGTALLGVILLAIGVWIFLRKMTDSGFSLEPDGTLAYQLRVLRALRGAIWLIAIGILWLLDGFNLMNWSDSWPWILILAGVFMILQRLAYNNAASAAYVPPVYTPPAPVPPAAESEPREGGR